MSSKKDRKRRYFLIDYENVNRSGLVGIEELSRSDRVIVFYSQNADSLSFGVMQMLSDTKAKVEYIKVDTIGRNALDFQLASYVGYLLGRDEGCKVYIVSNDRGYSNVQIFWWSRDQRVRLVPSIRDRQLSAAKKPDVRKAVSELEVLDDAEKQDAADVVWRHLKTGSPHLSHIKVGINNDLLSHFGSEKTKVIFNAIRPLIK